MEKNFENFFNELSETWLKENVDDRSPITNMDGVEVIHAANRPKQVWDIRPTFVYNDLSLEIVDVDSGDYEEYCLVEFKITNKANNNVVTYWLDYAVDLSEVTMEVGSEGHHYAATWDEPEEFPNYFYTDIDAIDAVSFNNISDEDVVETSVEKIATELECDLQKLNKIMDAAIKYTAISVAGVVEDRVSDEGPTEDEIQDYEDEKYWFAHDDYDYEY